MNAVLTIKAYERKAELGGGFRGRVYRPADKAVFESDVLPSLDAAKFWAQTEAHKLMGSRPYRRAHVAKRFTGGSYQANIWA